MQKRLECLDNQGYIQNGLVKHTRTTRFLMPLIGISEASIGYICPKLLINAHVKNVEEKFIFVILNKLDYPEESRDYTIIQNLNENFVDYIEEDEEIILMYKIPNHFNSDYDKILEGKYSETSIEYKQIITRVYGTGRNKEDHLPSIYDCLFPTDAKRLEYANFLNVDVKLINEVSSKPNLDYEIYKTIKQLTEDYGA